MNASAAGWSPVHASAPPGGTTDAYDTGAGFALTACYGGALDLGSPGLDLFSQELARLG